MKGAPAPPVQRNLSSNKVALKQPSASLAGGILPKALPSKISGAPIKDNFRSLKKTDR